MAGRPFPWSVSFPGADGRARVSAGDDPARVLLARGSRVELWSGDRVERSTGNPFDAVRSLLAGLARDAAAVGWFGYDLGRHLERLPSRAADDRGFPDLFLAVADPSGPRAVSPATYAREFFLPPPGGPEGSTFDRAAYLAAVRRAIDHVEAGEIYQVNLSQRFHARRDLDAAEIQRRLEAASPSPYSMRFECGNRAVVSSSPELFLRVEGRRVVTRPIKGTRRRGRDAAEDAALAAELLASPKDDAELAMIIDLERNDLGRVCETGSIRVAEPKVLESHPTVHHLVATVEGRLRPGVGPVDLLAATFPGGSITGAPKIRAMQVIDELEPTRRGAYTGALGRISGDGTVELAVGIRLVEKHGPDLWFQAGGGIVADSDPAREYEETLVKAAAIARALEVTLPDAAGITPA